MGNLSGVPGYGSKTKLLIQIALPGILWWDAANGLWTEDVTHATVYDEWIYKRPDAMPMFGTLVDAEETYRQVFSSGSGSNGAVVKIPREVLDNFAKAATSLYHQIGEDENRWQTWDEDLSRFEKALKQIEPLLPKDDDYAIKDDCDDMPF